MKRIFAFIVFLMFFANVSVLQSFAISAHSAIVIDAQSGRILYSHNETKKMGMASTTKILTAITALENGDINSIATVSPTAYGVEGSSMYLVLDEKLSLENLLYGLMLSSGNDAATAIAEHISGSVADFSVLMNKTAAKAGATNSNFTNPHGLSDENHYTTALDLAKITAYAMKNPKFREIVSTYKKSIPWKDHDYNRQLVNHNKFLNMYDGCIGVKTGFTKATGRCLVTAVEQEDQTLICVTLNAPDDWNDHKTLYDRVFSEYSAYKIKSKGEIVTTAEVKKGVVNSASLAVENDITISLTPTEFDNLEIKSVPYEDLQAPINKGDVLGYITIESNGTLLTKANLVAAESIEVKTVFPTVSNSGLFYSLKKVFYTWLTCFS